MGARPKVPTVDEVRKLLDASWTKWCAENGAPERIQRRLHERLDRKVDEIMAKLLGFDCRWDRWEIDHCNGRSGNSIIGDYLRQHTKGAVTAWIDKHMAELPELPKAAITEAKRAYLAAYADGVKRRVRELAEKAANDRAVRMVEELEATLSESAPKEGL